MENVQVLIENKADLANTAKAFLNSLENGETDTAYTHLNDLNLIKDKTLYNEIGKMTRTLHNSLVNFSLDTTKAGLAEQRDFVTVVDASDRLEFVIKTTEDAANKTMDMVEETVPISEQLRNRARDLKATWVKLQKRELSAEQFRDLYREIDNFLDETVENSDQLSNNLNNILLAQDFQDITGQVIKKVISIVQDVQGNLVDLVKLAASLQSISGLQSEFGNLQQEIEAQKDYLEGPAINKEQRDDVVNSQDDVDDLLSSLGF